MVSIDYSLFIVENTDKRPRVMHFCKVCNKGFSCGGALGGHMRAHGIEEVNARVHEENKRSYFLRTTTNRFVSYRAREEEDLANCLVMLSNGKADETMFAPSNENSLDLARDENEKFEEPIRGLFQCKACKKVFNSHQALGGHRASHKKIKGCFAAKFADVNVDYDERMVEGNDERELQKCPSIDLNHSLEQGDGFHISSFKMKSKMHECSICKRVFSSGQALGGHKRCHWLGSTLPENYPMPNFFEFQYNSDEPLFKKLMLEKYEPLDQNLSPLVDTKCSSKFEAQPGIYLTSTAEDEMGKNHWDRCADVLRGDNGEDHSKVKLEKLGDMRLNGECSTWLQIGIATNNDGRRETAS